MFYRSPIALIQLLSFIVLAQFLALPVLADSKPQRGKTADGRPYRIDRQGLKITDYIAELEVANDDLKRQLEAAELELEQKDRQLKSGNVNTARTEVRERDLVASQKNSNCDASIQELSNKLAQAEQRAKVQIPPACDYQSAANPYKQQIENMQARLSAAPSARDLESQSKRASELEAELGVSKEKLASLETQISTLESDLREARSTHAVLASRAALKPVESSPPPAALASAPESDGDVRGELRSSIQQIQKLAGERKSLLDSLRSRGKSVSISLRPLVAAGGKSLDSFRLEVERFNEKSDAGSIRAGLLEIKGILEDDISVLKRLVN